MSAAAEKHDIAINILSPAISSFTFASCPSTTNFSSSQIIDFHFAKSICFVHANKQWFHHWIAGENGMRKKIYLKKMFKKWEGNSLCLSLGAQWLSSSGQSNFHAQREYFKAKLVRSEFLSFPHQQQERKLLKQNFF